MTASDDHLHVCLTVAERWRPLRICTSCQTTFEPKPETFGIWATFILGFVTLFAWLITLWLLSRRFKCTACGCTKTLDMKSIAGIEYAKRFGKAA